MLDKELMQQTAELLNRLENPISLVYCQTEHEKQGDLVSLLKDIAEASDKISLRASEQNGPLPRFWIERGGQSTGIVFTGVPLGHEFSSLVLAILNTDGKGKLPDSALVERIRRLRGPVRIKTYISLSCENCPDVVQALNQMALHHDDFEHEMVDGQLVQEEVTRLAIMGVPSVIAGDERLSSGKVTFLELLEKLENKFGTRPPDIQGRTTSTRSFDVVVVGGGPAGFSAAIYSARKGLKTALVAEKTGGQVQDTKGIENLISVPYIEGPQLTAHLADHLSRYDVELLEHRRVESISHMACRKRSDIPNAPVNEGSKPKVFPASTKELVLDSGETLLTPSVIVATGAKWRELQVPGEKDYLGRGVAYCPHCDGPYFKGKDVAVIGGGNSGVEAALDLANIVKSVVLLEYASELKADQILVDQLKTRTNVRIICNAKTLEVKGNQGKVRELVYEDRQSEASKSLLVDGVFIQIGLIPNSSFLKGFVATNSYGEILVDEKGRTNIAGVYAAGDVTTTPFKQIVIALGEGAKAALTAFEDKLLGKTPMTTA